MASMKAPWASPALSMFRSKGRNHLSKSFVFEQCQGFLRSLLRLSEDPKGV